MKATFLKGVVLGSVVSCSIVIASAAFAGSGVGAVLNLGKFNGVNSTTALGGTSAGPQLRVTNTYGGPGATGIGITVHGGKPPLTVNSPTKVNNLNADQLDGLDSSKLQRRIDWAAVNSDGTFARGSSGASSSRITTGSYAVDFGHNVTGCSFVAGLGSALNSGPAPGFVGTARRDNNVNAVFVITRNSAAADADEAFYLDVVC